MDYNKLWEYCLKFKIQQKKDEFISFLKTLEKLGVKSVLEIGTNTGGTARGFLEMGMKTTCIDIVKYPTIKRLEMTFKDKFRFIEGDSRDVRTIAAALGAYDLVWIDGFHSEEICRMDYENYGHMGKYVAFHDIAESEHHTQHDCFVSKVWENIRKKGHCVEYLTDDKKWGGIGLKL